jgi:hypothetical protein
MGYLFGIGPEWLIGVNTSGTSLGNLIPITMTYFTIAACRFWTHGIGWSAVKQALLAVI